MTHILIVEARFYENLADTLAGSAIAELEQAGATFERIAVPGCFEIPAAVSIAINSGQYDGYVALGCVIRGETSHYDYVCAESARGLNELAITKLAAIGYGIITANTRQQAITRANPAEKNVGGRAARACLAMINLKCQMDIS